MSEEAWGEMAALSRRMARIEITLTERILALENEVAALKGQPEAGRTVYPDAQQIDWRDAQAASTAIARIMQRK